MKHHPSLTILALLISLLAGCSKHSGGAASSAAKVTDLGVVEFSDGIPIQQNLGGSRACVITPAVLTSGTLKLSIAILETNSDGVVRTLATPTVQGRVGRPVYVSTGDIGISLMPKIKQ
jgi:hypothetical protein